MANAFQKGHSFSRFIFNTVIPDFDPVSPAFFGKHFVFFNTD